MNVLQKITKTFVGSRNERLVKQYGKTVAEINAFERQINALGDEALANKTTEFKQRLNDGEALDNLLPEAFAVVRETSVRTLGLRHFDVQIIGGIALHQGKIAEMRTGEGKTLVATLPVYLNALTGKRVHVVTVNDYLAKRDAEWMSKIYHFLGLTVGTVTADMNIADKPAAYKSDVVYATNNELGFDYLRDNMAFSPADKVQQELNYAIIDEVDSILIDEARTPLIISGPADDYSDIYQKINRLIPQFSRQKEQMKNGEVIIEVEGDYTLDEKNKQAYFTDNGHAKAEQLLIDCGLLTNDSSLYDAKNVLLMQHLNAALRAYTLFHLDVDYLVQQDEIVIIDEFTGRALPGRRWSEGLHQAIEAKEKVKINKENQTLASITFQNYFRLYQKLSGMTGTADTESFELNSIYNLEVVVIPTNVAVNRKDFADLVYLTQQEKYHAIIAEIKKEHAAKRPILVGTSSVESSEAISTMLNKQHIKHEVLNAKQHEREAMIVANAGVADAITIATNMAGRGTDIVLGGKLADDATADDKKAWQQRHDAIIAAGGLHIVGAERNESRRVDNQLRGRAGRQGDPGSSRFFLSLEDNLMRIFASEKMTAMMQKIGLDEGEAIEHNWITRAIENAQKKVEGYHFDARKQILEYDNVTNEQRKFIYQKRNELMSSNDIKVYIEEIRDEVISDIFYQHISSDIPETDWNISALHNALSEYGLTIDLVAVMQKDNQIDNWLNIVLETFQQAHQQKEETAGVDNMRLFEKSVMLQILDQQWKEHLAAMDYLRQSINLRGYAQKNPVQEYKQEAFEMFKVLLNDINIEVVRIIGNVQVKDPEPDIYEQQTPVKAMQYSSHQDQPIKQAQQVTDASTKTYQREVDKVGRNDSCPCGSGKKYKRCHGS